MTATTLWKLGSLAAAFARRLTTRRQFLSATWRGCTERRRCPTLAPSAGSEARSTSMLWTTSRRHTTGPTSCCVHGVWGFSLSTQTRVTARQWQCLTSNTCRPTSQRKQSAGSAHSSFTPKSWSGATWTRITCLTKTLTVSNERYTYHGCHLLDLLNKLLRLTFPFPFLDSLFQSYILYYDILIIWKKCIHTYFHFSFGALRVGRKRGHHQNP